MKNLRRLYAGFAGKKLTEDGRTLINKDYDMSDNKAHQAFTAGNEPELHQTLDGKYQACVEKGTTNRITTAQHDFEGSEWEEAGGATATITQDQTIGSLTSQATRIQTTGGTSTLKYRWTGASLSAGDDFSLSCYIQNNGANNVVIQPNIGDFTGYDEQVVAPGELVWATAENQDADNGFSSQLRFSTQDADHDIDIKAWKPQAENNAYATLYVQGTRPAPSPVIQNALPETGTVGGVLRIVNTTGTDTIFGSWDGSDTDTLSRFRLEDDERIRLYIGGISGGEILQIIPFTWGVYTAETFAYGATWDVNDLKLYILHEGSIYSLSTSHTINATITGYDLYIGNNVFENGQRSSRFETLWYKDDTVRVNATDNEIKKFFEKLITGTSMQTKKEDMTIIP